MKRQEHIGRARQFAERAENFASEAAHYARSNDRQDKATPLARVADMYTDLARLQLELAAVSEADRG